MHYLPPEEGYQNTAIQLFFARGYAAHFGPVALAILLAVKQCHNNQTGPTSEDIAKLIGVSQSEVEAMLEQLHAAKIVQTVTVRVRPKPGALIVSDTKLKIVVEPKAWELLDNLALATA